MRLQLLLDGGRIEKEELTSDGAYILDCVSEIYPWTGKKCEAGARAAVMKVQCCKHGRRFGVWSLAASKVVIKCSS